MAQAHTGPIPDGLKQCPVCGEPVNVKAWKCIHCQSDLGRWRRKLGVSSTALALLVALVSVLTAAVPVLKETLTPKNSDIGLSFQGADANIVAVLISNHGTRPGSFRGALLELRNKGEPSVYLPLDIAGPGGPAVAIDAGRGILLNLISFKSRQDESFKRFSFKGTGVTCLLHYRVTDFLGHTYYPQKALDCEEVKVFVEQQQKFL